MIGAFVNSENWIQLTSVQMARNRRDDYGRGGSSGALRRQRYGEGGYHPRQPRWKLLFITLIIVLLGWGLLVGIGSCVSYLNTRLQKYMPLTETAEVVELTIIRTREEHQLSVSLTLVEANGYYKPVTRPILMQGDKVLLEYEYIIVPGWLGFWGLHSGYILTKLKGYYNTGTSSGSSLILNKADNDNSLPAQIVSPFVSSKFASIILMPSRSIYKICITPTGQLSKGC